MTNIDGTPSKFFVTGGNLEVDALSYVKRSVDDELLNLVLAGEFCYGLTARQLGKSSLMVRTAQRLQTHGVHSVIIDLTTIGSDVSVEQWYLGLLTRLKSQLNLAADLEAWWQKRATLGSVQRFLTFLHDVVLAEIEGPVVIFVDEIDTTLNLSFSDDFFAAIRFIYNARATDSIYQRLIFVLFGVVTPSDLIKDRSRTPFNIGHRLDIREFSRAEARVLQEGLQAVYPERGEAILDRIFDWTYGHPYLTQKLCRQVVETDNRTWTDAQIDQLVEKLFLSDEACTETNLQFVRDNIQAHPQRGRLLTLYRQVHTGRTVAEDERSIEQNRLKLLGLVRVEKGVLKVRNEIYRQAFNLAWIKANTPSEWTWQIIVVSVIVIVLLILGIGFVLYQQKQQTIEARATAAAEDFRLPSAEVRLDSLAQLLDLPGYEDDARCMFFELEPTEQRAIFNLANPQAVEEQLITVIKGLYTDPRMNEQGAQLLQAMVQPLSALPDTDDYTIKNLVSELDSWSQGREHHARGEYQQALIAYDAAISLNNENPGTHFDRALAYAALDRPEQALADLETVLSLNEAWQEQVRQTVIRDGRLYGALWNKRETYQVIAALVPTAIVEWKRDDFSSEQTGWDNYSSNVGATGYENGQYFTELYQDVTFISVWGGAGGNFKDGVLQVDIGPLNIGSTQSQGISFGGRFESEDKMNYAFAVNGSGNCHFLGSDYSRWYVRETGKVIDFTHVFHTVTVVIRDGQAIGYVDDTFCAQYTMPNYEPSYVGVVASDPEGKGKLYFDNYRIFQFQ